MCKGPGVWGMMKRALEMWLHQELGIQQIHKTYEISGDDENFFCVWEMAECLWLLKYRYLIACNSQRFSMNIHVERMHTDPNVHVDSHTSHLWSILVIVRLGLWNVESSYDVQDEFHIRHKCQGTVCRTWPSLSQSRVNYWITPSDCCPKKVAHRLYLTQQGNLFFKDSDMSP